MELGGGGKGRDSDRGWEVISKANKGLFRKESNKKGRVEPNKGRMCAGRKRGGEHGDPVREVYG